MPSEGSSKMLSNTVQEKGKENESIETDFIRMRKLPTED